MLSVIPTFIIPLLETCWFRLIWCCLQLLPNTGPNILLSVCGFKAQNKTGGAQWWVQLPLADPLQPSRALGHRGPAEPSLCPADLHSMMSYPKKLLCLGALKMVPGTEGCATPKGMLPYLPNWSYNYVVYTVIICFNPIIPLTIT